MSKIVNVQLALPDNANYIACDSDGLWYWFEEKPCWNVDTWDNTYWNTGAEMDELPYLLPHKDPENSLQCISENVYVGEQHA